MREKNTAFESNALGVFAIDGYQNNSSIEVSAYVSELGLNVLFPNIQRVSETHHVPGPSSSSVRTLIT